MNEDEEMLIALRRLYIHHERALRTSVGFSAVPELRRDFRYVVIDFIMALGLDPDTTRMLESAAMNPLIPKGDAIWED